MCSLRMGPVLDGVDHCWHLERTAGADAVFTLPPAFLTEFIQRCRTRASSRGSGSDPFEVMAKLRSVPYFNRGYDLGGIPVDEFNDIPSLQSTAREFFHGNRRDGEFVRETKLRRCEPRSATVFVSFREFGLRPGAATAGRSPRSGRRVRVALRYVVRDDGLTLLSPTTALERRRCARFWRSSWLRPDPRSRLAYVRHSREFDPRREQVAQHDAEQRLERGAAQMDVSVARYVEVGAAPGRS